MEGEDWEKEDSEKFFDWVNSDPIRRKLWDSTTFEKVWEETEYERKELWEEQREHLKAEHERWKTLSPKEKKIELIKATIEIQGADEILDFKSNPKILKSFLKHFLNLLGRFLESGNFTHLNHLARCMPSRRTIKELRKYFSKK